MRMRKAASLTGAIMTAAFGITAPAFAESRVAVAPYLELDQTLVADLSGGDGDVMTYTSAAAGVDARITTRDLEAQANLRYEHSFGESGNIGDQDVISGIARIRATVIDDILSLEGGAIATRTRSDFVGANASSLAGNFDAVSKIYSAYAGPTLTKPIGDFTLNAAYRVGYTRVEDDAGFGVPGQSYGRFEESVFQSGTASIGIQPGPLPVGLSLGVGYDREDASQLDQRFQDKWVRADITVPVSASTALVGGIGYEDLDIGQRDVLRDADGAPVVSDSGRYVTDKDSPRRLSYDFDGLIWDAGVLWRPSRRTSLEARVGQRYGSMRYTGSFSWQPDRNSSFNVTVFDGIESFGRLLNGSLVGLGSNFNATRNPFSGDLDTCVYTAQGGGQCFNDALAGISAANFRHRGISAQYAAERGPWNWGVAAGYARRKFIAPQDGLFASVDGATDENYYLNLLMGRKIDQQSGVSGTLYANFYDAGLAGNVDVLNAGAYASYYRNFTRKLTGTASVGVDGVDPKGIDSIISALAQVGLRYQF
ncbi:hypothetical protein BH10PSE12_BH10PSE12_11090 [soil metagenome]